MELDYYKQFEPIDGKWIINKELGSGSFGTVFEVQRKDFSDMKAALKVISIPNSKNEYKSFCDENYELDEKSITSYFYGFVEEFTKEFQVMFRLKGHSNIVCYEDHDVRKKKDEFGWDIFIRMELLTPMNEHFKTTPPKQSDVIKIGIDLCKALEICQKYNIIHRDIKPSNVFISDSGEYKLGDFGVARTLEKTTGALSKKGTYTYMAPEVFKGEKYNSNVDIYSLGILMYKLLNNNMEPFRTDKSFGDGEMALEKRMNGEEIPAPVNSKGRLAEIVLKACSFDPKERYESPLQMRKELELISYEEGEGKYIYPEGDTLDYEPSTQGIESSIEEEKTISLFQSSPEEKTVSIFDGHFDNQTVEEPVETQIVYSGLSELFPEWYEMISELTTEEILERINDIDEWSDEYHALCVEEYHRRTGIWNETKLSTQDKSGKKNTSKFNKKSINNSWKEAIHELSDLELIERYNSDEWQDEYRQLCYDEANNRNFSLDSANPVEIEIGELNFYEINIINQKLEALSDSQIEGKIVEAKKIISDRNTTPKEKIIAKYILSYFNVEIE